MTRKEAKELLPIIQAFAEGKEIEYYDCNDDFWIKTDTPMWSSKINYRIKPEPKYRPFESKEECWNEMLKHQPIGWLKEKKLKKEISHIGQIFETPDDVIIRLSNDEGRNLSSSYFFRTYTFADGTPFGIKE